MTSLDLDKLLSIEKARILFPIPPSANTLLVWCSTGANGVKLQTIRIGRRLYTSREWVEEFVRAQNPEQSESRDEKVPASS